LVEEIEDLGVGEKKAVKSNLVVVLQFLLKYQFQPRRRSRGWRASILEHRQRLRDDLRTSPSLRGHAEAVFEEAYADARAAQLPRPVLLSAPSHPPHPTPSSRPAIRTSCRTRSSLAAR
jgi:hypothetical protein